jgi:hypothetical protein
MFMSGKDEDRKASDRAARDFILASFDVTADGQSGAPDERPEPLDFRRAKRKVLLAMLLVFALSGFLLPLTGAEVVLRRGVDIATAIGTTVLILQWCAYDCRQRMLRRWPYFGLMLVLCPGPLILMPIYFFATRGWRGLISILKALVLFTLAVVAMLAGFAVSATIFGGWEHFRDNGYPVDSIPSRSEVMMVAVGFNPRIGSRDIASRRVAMVEKKPRAIGQPGHFNRRYATNGRCGAIRSVG